MSRGCLFPAARNELVAQIPHTGFSELWQYGRIRLCTCITSAGVSPGSGPSVEHVRCTRLEVTEWRADATFGVRGCVEQFQEPGKIADGGAVRGFLE
jgi:hypothetical protein